MSNTSSLLLEACIESVAEAIHAAEHGAQQLELCSRLDLDGLTPSYELIQAVQQACSLRLKVMIRPRAGDFVYSASELDQMKEAINWCKANGISEIVLGVLDSSNNIDTDTLRLLAKLASPMEITFHKAFDLINDPLEGLQTLKKIPSIKYLLTSGQARSAWEGRALLKEMVAQSGDQLEIIVAGKVRPTNIKDLHAAIGAKYYHGRGIV